MENNSTIENIENNDIDKKDEEETNILKDPEEKDNFKYEEKNISIFKLYKHLNKPIDYFLLFLALIGSIGSGISLPFLIYIFSDIFSDIGNTSECKTIEDILVMMETLENTFNNQIKKFLIFGSISFIFNFLNIFFWNLIGQRNISHFKYKYFFIILNQEQKWFDQINPYELINKIQTQIEYIELGINNKLGNICTKIIQSITGFILAFITSIKLTLVILCITPIIIIIKYFMFKSIKKDNIISKKEYEKSENISKEIIDNIKTIASFSNFDFEKNRYNEQIDICNKMEIKNIKKLVYYNSFIIFLLNCIIFISFLYGRTLIEKELNKYKGRSLKVGDIIIVTFCNIICIIGFDKILSDINILRQSCKYTSDYFTLYEKEIFNDKSNTMEEIDINKFKGNIIFKDVIFKYPNDKTEKIILNKLNMEIDSGKKIAFVGESGCGKSTIINLLERLYDINEGEINIDNIDIKKYNINNLRSLIGYAQKETVLFNVSIKDNIIFGREELLNKIGDINNLIQKVCDELYITEFIKDLPGGLDYILDMKNNILTESQKQRIALARAIITNPKILILDDIDNNSEIEFQKALNNIIQKNITIIIISNNLNIIKNVDVIYAIKEGNIIEKGTHKELLEKKGYYFNLIKYQIDQEKQLSINNEQNFNNKILKKDSDINDIEISRLLGEIPYKKINMYLACLGSAIVGGLTPSIGMIIGNIMNAFNSKFQTFRYDKGLKYSLLFLFFTFLQGLGNILMNYQFMILETSLILALRKKILSKYFQIHLSFYDLKMNYPHFLLNKLSIDPVHIKSFLFPLLGLSVQVPIILIISFILGCIYEYHITLIIFFFISFIIIIKRISNCNSTTKEINIEAKEFFSQCIFNIKIINIYNYQNKAVQKYKKILDIIKNKLIKDYIIKGFFIGLGQYIIFLTNAIILYTSKNYILKGEKDLEDLCLVMCVIIISIIKIKLDIENIDDLNKAKIAYKSLYNILDTQNKINEGKINPKDIKGKIEFKNVNFSYPTKPNQIIFKDLNFVVEPGQHILFIGNGKNTINELLERFYDIEDGNGEILIDDINIKEFNLYKLRRKIGLINKNISIFKRSLLDNIRYGKLYDTLEDCEKAAKEANIKLDKKEGEISKKEKLSIDISRNFLKNNFNR